jgi:hypothetical protein
MNDKILKLQYLRLHAGLLLAKANIRCIVLGIDALMLDPKILCEVAVDLTFPEDDLGNLHLVVANVAQAQKELVASGVYGQYLGCIPKKR